jgi:hypothetical protein
MKQLEYLCKCVDHREYWEVCVENTYLEKYMLLLFPLQKLKNHKASLFSMGTYNFYMEF